MQVRKNGWFFQVAHMFVPYFQQPERVDRCTLVWLFALCFVPWVIASTAAWIAFGLILGVGGHLVMWPVRFLIEARRPVFEGVRDAPRWLPGRNALSHLCILSYDKKDIEWLEWMVWVMNPEAPSRNHFYDGRLRSPLVFIIGCVTIPALLYFASWYAIPALWHQIVPAGAHTVQVVIRTFSWWMWGPITLAAVLALHYVWKRFAASEPGTVLIAHFKDWKREHCPIYEVV